MKEKKAIRNRFFKMRLNASEFDKLTELSKRLNLTKTDTIKIALSLYDSSEESYKNIQ